MVLRRQAAVVELAQQQDTLRKSVLVALDQVIGVLLTLIACEENANYCGIYVWRVYSVCDRRSDMLCIRL